MKYDFESQIENILDEDIKIPESILRKKEMAFEQIRNKPTKIRGLNIKKIAAAIIGLSIIGTFMFRIDAIAELGSALFGDSGAQKAINNGYIQEITEDSIMRSSGVDIKANNIAYTSNKLIVSLNIKFEDKSLLQYFYAMKAKVDVYDNSKKEVIEFVGAEYNINFDREKGEVTYNVVLTSRDKLKDLSNVKLKINNIELLANAKDNLPEEFIKEAESKLDVDTIKQLDEAGVVLYKEIEGQWESDIELDNKFKEDKDIKYAASNENQYVQNILANMNSTGTDVSFIIDKADYKSVGKTNLLDDKGNIYKLSDGGSQSWVEGDETKVQVVLSFDATSFDNIDSLKIEFRDIHEKDFDINLIKQ
ncbi:DUF4179 domain-containing protein [Clostridium intestinale]|uniref:DUF4179 domain-containing protein n=1 Tax=Clostridium intestinale TaxID=36845 RepID=A0A7D7A0N2_9CLOT|nr:DUF4179 domain-containing protein [Clostridium intestinale]QLY80155.1 DUF4179 domain-containing protein [Clostridium intestinale]